LAAAEEEVLQIEGYLPLKEITLPFVEELERLAPFGPGNPPPILVSRDLTLKQVSEIGREGEHLQLVVEDNEGNTQRVLWWQGAGWPLPQGKFDLAYTVRSSDYRGERQVQVEWVDFREVEETAVEAAKKETSFEVVDYRQEGEKEAVLARVRATESLLVWAEGEARVQVGGVDRCSLTSSPALAVWTTPPAQEVWEFVLEQVQPRRVYLFCVHPGLDELEPFLKRLAGLLKYALKSRQGRVKWCALAAAMAHRRVTVRKGLDWLVARGWFTVEVRGEEELQIAPAVGEPAKDLPQFTRQLEAMLREAAAFRAFFCQAGTSRPNPHFSCTYRYGVTYAEDRDFCAGTGSDQRLSGGG
jgi:single-stranded-DNA-specific exonuclease